MHNEDDIVGDRLPISNLETTQSLIRSNTKLSIYDTPPQWLYQLPLPEIRHISISGELGGKCKEYKQLAEAGTLNNP